MSKYIGQLLQADQRNLDSFIARLESICLNPGVDTSLTAEIITQSREKVRALGFDPSISTAEELYYGLLSRAEADDQVLRDKLLNGKNSAHEASEIIARKCNQLNKKDIVICMNQTAVKQILKAVPPKRTLRQLKFRSIDSVLKRENPLVLYALAMRIEDKSWRSQVSAKLKRLSPRDVREQKVQIITLPSDWLDKLQKQNFDNLLQSVPEAGVVLLLPTDSYKVKGSVLLACGLVLQASQRMSVDALSFRSQVLNKSYEQMLPDVANGLLDEFEPVHGLRPNWHVVYRWLAEVQYKQIGDFEFILDDLEWQSTETKLASIASELDFWVNTHYLGFSAPSNPISMHFIDVSANLVLGKKFGEHISTHLKTSLFNELQVRYIKQEVIEKSIISQLTRTQEVML